jgi:hypothetical protein
MNNVTDTLQITVLDVTNPSINNQPDVEMIEGSLGNVLVWISTELHPATYNLYLDDLIIETDAWNSNVQIIYSIDDLLVGSYNFTMELIDTSGNRNVDQAIVNVIDETLPNVVLFAPQSSNYQEGLGGNVLQLIGFDLYPQNYTILKDEVPFTTGTWEANIQQLISIDGFAKGDYNLTLILEDESGNQQISSIIITVRDFTVPEFTSLPETERVFEENASNKVIELFPVDLYPNVFEIFENGTLMETGDWSNDTAIVFDMTAYLLGSYGIRFVIYDQSNNTLVWEIGVTIIHLTAPVLTQQPSSEGIFTIITNTTGNFVNWEFFDNHPESYLVELDGVSYDQGIWQNNETISIQVDGQSFGIYNLTIKVKDTSNNLLTAYILLRVNDPEIIRTQAPEFSIRPQAKEGELEYVTSVWNNENGTAIETGEITVQLRSSGLIYREDVFSFQDGEWTILFNYTSQIPGEYRWTVVFSQSGYESQLVELSVQIIQHQVEISYTKSSRDVVQGDDFIILVNVSYINTDISLGLDQTGNTVIQRSGGVEGLELEVIIRYKHILGDNQFLQRNEITDENGQSVIILEGEVTINILSISSIGIYFGGNPAIETEEIDQEEEIGSEPPRPNPFEVLISLAIEVIGLIIGVLVVILISGILYWYYADRRTKHVNEIMENISNDFDEITSMMEIKAIILQNHGGIPIYLEESGKLGVDGVLISGFSKAISTFLDEIERSVVTGFESIQRDTFAINSFSTGLGRIIFLADESLPDIMKVRMIEIMTEVERNFSENLHGGLSLHPSDFESVVSRTNLKYTLLHPFQLNKRAIANAIKMRSLSRTTKENFSYLLSYQNTSGNRELTLERLFNILRSRLLPPSLVTQIISTGYSLGIFSPVIKDVEG